jgi:hypothetical protein
MYPKAISQRLGFANVKVLNVSRPELEVNNDLAAISQRLGSANGRKFLRIFDLLPK